MLTNVAPVTSLAAITTLNTATMTASTSVPTSMHTTGLDQQASSSHSILHPLQDSIPFPDYRSLTAPNATANFTAQLAKAVGKAATSQPGGKANGSHLGSRQGR